MKSVVKVVIDTNVFVSALIGSKVCKKIYELLKQDRFELVISFELIKEITSVLKRTKFELEEIELEKLKHLLWRKSEIVFPKNVVSLCRDPKDNIVLECASAGKPDFIVTGDKDLLSLKKFKNIPIITPSKFVKLIRGISP
jgi:putative PIN family toxin of toxin-antitoxin system